MAWTVPRTWTTSETVTAAIMNTHVRDNLNAIGAAWTAYGSGSSWTSGGTAPSLGNGTWSAQYMQAGKLVWGVIVMTIGSTTTNGTLAYNWALPVTALRGNGTAVGSAVVQDASPSTNYGAAVMLQSTTTIRIVQGGTAGGSVSATSPITPATGDVFSLQFMYEAA